MERSAGWWQGEIRRSTLFALLAAGLFGLSTPLAKLLLARIPPLVLASLLYLGSGIGVTGLKLSMELQRKGARKEAPLERGDLRWFVPSIIAGGIAAPAALLLGLSVTPASTASLLLNFEAAATAVLGAALFREEVGRRVWIAVLVLTAAACILSIRDTGDLRIPVGALLILGACTLWALDNNLTRPISVKDPFSIAGVKGVIAGITLFSIAGIAGMPLPASGMLAIGLVLGFLTYGISIVLYIRAMRDLGAVRACSFLSTAPFAGAALSLLLLGELVDPGFLFAFATMAVGVWLLLKEQHCHAHCHLPLQHDHVHDHRDGHHNHHGGVPATAVHAHPHRHTHEHHEHPHRPDLHHRHGNEGRDDRD